MKNNSKVGSYFKVVTLFVSRGITSLFFSFNAHISSLSSIWNPLSGSSTADNCFSIVTTTSVIPLTLQSSTFPLFPLPFLPLSSFLRIFFSIIIFFFFFSAFLFRFLFSYSPPLLSYFFFFAFSSLLFHSTLSLHFFLHFNFLYFFFSIFSPFKIFFYFYFFYFSFLLLQSSFILPTPQKFYLHPIIPKKPHGFFEFLKLFLLFPPSKFVFNLLNGSFHFSINLSSPSHHHSCQTNALFRRFNFGERMR